MHCLAATLTAVRLLLEIGLFPARQVCIVCVVDCGFHRRCPALLTYPSLTLHSKHSAHSLQDIDQGYLMVPGGPFSLLLPRSSEFAPLMQILRLRYPRALDTMLIFPIIQVGGGKAAGSMRCCYCSCLSSRA